MHQSDVPISGRNMKLTRFTDYSLRVLIYLGLQGEQRVTIRESSEAYKISRNHLMKVVSMLTRMGYLDARRGPGGGIALARPPDEINLADVIRAMEDDMNLVECFCDGGDCIISPVCQLKKVLAQALNTYLGTLEDYTLKDLLNPGEELGKILGLKPRAA
jgi:Rrf2 family nitric oxide-sensitive transcriptional repressor